MLPKMNLINQKWLLLYSFLFLPLIAAAQKDSARSKIPIEKDTTIYRWDIKLGVGLSANTIPNKNDDWHKEEKAAQINIAKNIGAHYQLGIELSFVNMGYAKAGTFITNGRSAIVYNERIYAKPAIPICLFGNYRFRFGYSIFYVGLSAGYMWTKGNSNASETMTENNVSSITFGGHIGYQYLLGKRLSIAATANLRYCNLKTQQEDNTYKATPIYYYPITVGVGYRLK